MGSTLSYIYPQNEQQTAAEKDIPPEVFISPLDMAVQQQMQCLLKYWIRKSGHNPSTFPADVIQLIINTFTHQSIFDVEQRLKLDSNEDYYSKIGRYYNCYSKTPSQYDYLFKVIVIGNSGVGKTSIIHRFANDEWYGARGYITLLGIDFMIRTIEVDGYKVKFQIWDTAGQERFNAVNEKYYQNIHGAMIVYDVADRQSMERLSSWNSRCQKNAPPTHHRVLLGNKRDLIDNREVSMKSGKEMAEQLGIEHFYETSAKTGENVDAAFKCLAKQILLTKYRVTRPWFG